MRFDARAMALLCFLLLVMPLVAFCALRVPLGQVPDEPTHIARVESVLRGEMVGYRVNRPNPDTGAADAGVTGNIGLALAAEAGNGAQAPLPASASAAQRLAWAEAIPWAPAPQFISSVNTAAYAPPAYLPAALGLGLAIAFGAGPHNAAIAARFGNVLAFALLGLAALALAQRGRLLLLVILALPMTVWLAGSCNQDGVLIAVSVLAAALLTRGGSASFWTGTLLLALLALQKPPFLALLLLVLVAPGAEAAGTEAPGAAGRRWRRRLGAVLLVALPGLCWSVLVMREVSVPLLPGPDYHPGPLWPGDAGTLFRSAIAAAQAEVILHHPFRAALLPLTGQSDGLPSLWVQLIGVLGPFTLRLSNALYAIFTLALLSAAGSLMAVEPPLAARRWGPLRPQWAALIALVGSVELIFMVQYLTWTPVGAARIDGVQGRYFIPLLPVLVFLLPHLRGLRRLPAAAWWIAPLLALAASDLALPALIARHYYS